MFFDDENLGAVAGEGMTEETQPTDAPATDAPAGDDAAAPAGEDHVA